MLKHLILSTFISGFGFILTADEPAESPKSSAEVSIGVPEVFGTSKAGWASMKKEIPQGCSFFGLQMLPPGGKISKIPFPFLDWIEPESLDWSPSTETKGDSFYYSLAFPNNIKAAGWPTLAFAPTKAAAAIRTVSFMTAPTAPVKEITVKLILSLSEQANAEGALDPNTSGDILESVTVGNDVIAVGKPCIAPGGYDKNAGSGNIIKFSSLPVKLPLKPSTKYTFTIKSAPFAQAYAPHMINGFILPSLREGVAAPDVKYEKTETCYACGRRSVSSPDMADKAASTGKSLRIHAESGGWAAAGDLYIYPPYPGLYRFTFRMKIDNNSGDAKVLRLAAAFPEVANPELPLTPKDFKAAGTYQEFTVRGIVPENIFGHYMVAFNPEVKRTVWWDNVKYELVDYYCDQQTAQEFYPGFKMPADIARESGDEKLRTHVEYGANYDSSKIREALTLLGKKAPETVNLPADMRSYKPTGSRKPGEWKETAFIDHLQVRDRVPGFPKTQEELSKLDLVVLANVPIRSLGAPSRLLLHDWVEKAGGGLLLTGGSMALGKGYAEGTSLLPVLPVELNGSSDTRPAKDGLLVFKNPALKAIAGEEKIATRFYQDVKVKPGADVLISTADGAPLLVSWKCGKGKVTVWAGLPLGQVQEGQSSWWKSSKWPEIMAQAIANTTGR